MISLDISDSINGLVNLFISRVINPFLAQLLDIIRFQKSNFKSACLMALIRLVILMDWFVYIEWTPFLYTLKQDFQNGFLKLI